MARAAFQQRVDAIGASRRQMTFEELVRLEMPLEGVTIEGRGGRISTFVERESSVRVKIVVQGFLDGRIFVSWQTVALDGFYMDATGAIAEFEPHEFWDYD